MDWIQYPQRAWALTYSAYRLEAKRLFQNVCQDGKTIGFGAQHTISILLGGKFTLQDSRIIMVHVDSAVLSDHTAMASWILPYMACATLTLSRHINSYSLYSSSRDPGYLSGYLANGQADMVPHQYPYARLSMDSSLPTKSSFMSGIKMMTMICS